MTTAETITLNSQQKKKKSIFKRWWFWLLSVIALIIIIAAMSSGSGSPATVYELSKMQTMTKQQIIEKFGKPDEIVREDSDGYSFAYNGGFMVSGTDQEATEIELAADMVKSGSADSYKMFDVTLGSSFDENTKRLGQPDLQQEKDGQKNALYLTDEDFLIMLSTGTNSDQITNIRYTTYNDSLESMSLDLSNLLGLSATEDDIRSMYSIIDQSSSNGETLYDLNGFRMVVDDTDQIVKQLILSSDSIYNIHGVRITDKLERANEILGDPANTSEGVKDTIRYKYQFEGGSNPTIVNLSVDQNDQIGYMDVALQQ